MTHQMKRLNIVCIAYTESIARVGQEKINSWNYHDHNRFNAWIRWRVREDRN